MNDILQRILQIMDKREIKASEFCKATGIKQSTFATWKQKNRNPQIEYLPVISDFLGVSQDYLTGRIVDNVELMPATNSTKTINVYGSVPAGVPIKAIEDIKCQIDIPLEWTKGGQEYIALKVKGDSMFPKYLDGDTIVIRLQPDCENGQECVVFVNGDDATFKKVIKKDNCVILQPLNPIYDPIIVDFNDESKPFRILGVIVQLRREL